MAKILILSSSFNAGDAITMMNLFAKWEKAELFLATPSPTPYVGYFSSCYYLGNREQKIPYLFRPFMKIPNSQLLSKPMEQASLESGTSKTSFIKKLYKIVVLPLLQYIGLYDRRYSLSVSDTFTEWVKEVNPDIIYSPVSNGIMMSFLLQCQEMFPNVKFVFHGFDDWFKPAYKVLFRKKNIRNLENKYKQLISRADLLLSTTEMMAREYKTRYGCEMITFHNPVDLSSQGSDVFYFADDKYHITYIGKIAWHNALAIRNMQKAILMYNQNHDKPLVLDVYTQTNEEILNYFKIIGDDNMEIHKPIPNSQILALLKGSDILFLPITVTKEVATFTKFSMSTKMGEYLSSGSSVIYCGPKDIAMTQFIEDNDIALYTTEDGTDALLELIDVCLNNRFFTAKKVDKGIEVAKKSFDKDVISNDFYKTILKLIHK